MKMKYFKLKLIIIIIILLNVFITKANCFKLKKTLIDRTDTGYQTKITKINIYSTTSIIIYLASGSSTGTVTIWDIENEKI